MKKLLSFVLSLMMVMGMASFAAAEDRVGADPDLVAGSTFVKGYFNTFEKNRFLSRMPYRKRRIEKVVVYRQGYGFFLIYA